MMLWQHRFTIKQTYILLLKAALTYHEGPVYVAV